MLIAKPNQPKLHAQLIELPWRQIPIVDERCDRGHGRMETRLADAVRGHWRIEALH